MLRKLLAFVMLLSLSAVALAHTRLSSSAPADNASLAAAPEALELAFSEAVTLTALSLRDANGKEYALGAMPTAAQREISVHVPALPAGSYTVVWRAVGADTHVVSGEIHFAVTAG
jgi:methionine-rich copper-binding protein CopC